MLRIAMIDRLGPQGRPTLRQDLLVDPSGCGSIDVPTLVRGRPASVLLDWAMTRGWVDLPEVRDNVPAPAGGELKGSW